MARRAVSSTRSSGQAPDAATAATVGGRPAWGSVACGDLAVAVLVPISRTVCLAVWSPYPSRPPLRPLMSTPADPSKTSDQGPNSQLISHPNSPMILAERARGSHGLGVLGASAATDPLASALRRTDTPSGALTPPRSSRREALNCRSARAILPRSALRVGRQSPPQGELPAPACLGLAARGRGLRPHRRHAPSGLRCPRPSTGGSLTGPR